MTKKETDIYKGTRQNTSHVHNSVEIDTYFFTVKEIKGADKSREYQEVIYFQAELRSKDMIKIV